MELSVIIPARNEQFLSRTIEDILSNIEADTEVVIVLDGVWAEPVIPQHERVNVIYVPEAIGQRAASNIGVKLAQGKYVMKVDAHCAFDKGFDRKILDAFKELGDTITVAPTMKNLWVFDWVCSDGHRRYQGRSGSCLECFVPGHKHRGDDRTAECKLCGKETTRDMKWIGKERPNSRSFCFDAEPHFQYFNEYTKRAEVRKMADETGYNETMSLQGSCFVLTKDKYWELEICDEKLGNWGNQGIEVAVKTWLSGGRVLVSHKTWYAHLFRTQGGDFGFPWKQSQSDVERTKKNVKDLLFTNKWDKAKYPISWLVEKFWPIKGWSQEDLTKLKEV